MHRGLERHRSDAVVFLVAVGVVAVGVAVVIGSQAPAPEASVTAAPVAPEAPAGPCGAGPHAAQHRGVCYAHNWQDGGARGYGSETSERSLDELAALGMTWISITPFGYQPTLEATEVRRVNWPAAESDSRLRRTIENAHERGLQVMMKPHLWISYNDWRGNIQPEGDDGWERWFTSYEQFILHYARLSEEAGADVFVVGVELASSALEQPDRWRLLIGRVREVYTGPLVYAANWDTVERLTFWDALDFIGVQMFAPLSDHPDPSRDELRTAARGYLKRFRAVSERFGRPLILTEVGYKSIDGSAVAPWTWPEHLSAQGRVVDERDQADAYCAILEVFATDESVAGIYWWKWFTDPHTDEEGPEGFSPRGKLAEELLRAAYL